MNIKCANSEHKRNSRSLFGEILFLSGLRPSRYYPRYYLVQNSPVTFTLPSLEFALYLLLRKERTRILKKSIFIVSTCTTFKSNISEFIYHSCICFFIPLNQQVNARKIFSPLAMKHVWATNLLIFLNTLYLESLANSVTLICKINAVFTNNSAKNVLTEKVWT